MCRVSKLGINSRLVFIKMRNSKKEIECRLTEVYLIMKTLYSLTIFTKSKKMFPLQRFPVQLSSCAFVRVFLSACAFVSVFHIEKQKLLMYDYFSVSMFPYQWVD